MTHIVQGLEESADFIIVHYRKYEIHFKKSLLNEYFVLIDSIKK